MICKIVDLENNINKSSVSVGGGRVNIKVWNVAQSGGIEHRVNNIGGTTNFGIMARVEDIMRFQLVGNVSGSIRELELYADDSYIVRPTGGNIHFTQLDPQ